MYIHYSIGNNSGPRSLVRIVEVTVIGGVRFRRFHCTITLAYLVYMHTSAHLIPRRAVIPNNYIIAPCS